MRLILVSAITGHDLRGSMQSLAGYLAEAPRSKRLFQLRLNGTLHPCTALDDSYPGIAANSTDIVWCCLEDWLPSAASSSVKKLPGFTHSEPKLGRILLLPYSELANVCDAALRAAAAALCETPCTTAFLLFHPVLFHQQTSELVCPYDFERLRIGLEDLNLTADTVVSLHDDIYDIHRRLLPEEKLFGAHFVRKASSAEKHRQAILDLEQQRFLLSWRAQELAHARSLARSLDARHVLLHLKTRVSTFWEFVGEGRSAVYFSHPISEPRRHITKRQEKNGPLRSPKTGWAFIKECNELADLLAQQVPLVEPADIDELRIADSGPCNGLKGLTEPHLREAILPPLTSRWPITTQSRLSRSGDVSDYLLGDEEIAQISFPPVPPATFRGLSGAESLKSFRTAVSLLTAEIKRQIRIRDYALTEQADLVVVYRPYVHPASARPSGGVNDEISAASRKVSLGIAVCEPAVVIIHPKGDEVARRRLYFDENWARFVENRLVESTADVRDTFSNAARELLANIPYSPQQFENTRRIARDQLQQLMKDLNLSFRPSISAGASSMGRNEYAEADVGQAEFLDHIVDQNAFVVPDVSAGKHVEILDLTTGFEVVKHVRDILENYAKKHQTRTAG